MNRLSLGILVLLAGCGAAVSPPPPAPPPVAVSAAGAAGATGEEGALIPISARNPTWGSRTALVTIVEFADYQCPFCRVGEATLAKVRAAYGPEQIRVVWKDAPLDFHAEAHPTAEAAAGVFALGGASAFWKFHDAVFAAQTELGVDSSVKWARDAGVDGDVVRAGLVGRRWAPSVDADLADAQAAGVQGTPTFFVNGVQVVGARPFEFFRALVEEQLTAARAKLAAGTPPDRLYAELTRDNRAGAGAPKGQGDDDAEEEDSRTVYKVALGTSPSRGGPAPLVTVVEFGDYQCSFCARAEETLKALREKYGDKLRVVFKDAPLSFHPRAEPAAQAALQAREEKGDLAFWQMHDALFAGQGDLSDTTLMRLAATFGVRPDRVKTAIEKHTHRQSIDDDLDAADDLHADGTPHFFIDGRRLAGSQPIEKFSAIIDEELKKAQDLVAHGTPPADVYDALTRGGQGPAAPETRDLPASLAKASPARGGPQAKVVIHEWSDFQCPFCARAEPTVAEVLKEYGGRVKLVWHDLPLPMHPSAPLAAQAGREALKQKGEKAFWSLHDTILSHQPELGRESLDGWARTLGLDMDRWKASLDKETHQAELEPDSRAADEAGIHGTPAFLIAASGSKTAYLLTGAQPYSRFHKLIERALGGAH